MWTKIQDWLIRKVFEGKLLGWLSGSKRDVGNILLLLSVAATGLQETLGQAAVVFPEQPWLVAGAGFMGALIRILGDMHAQAKERAGLN